MPELVTVTGNWSIPHKAEMSLPAIFVPKGRVRHRLGLEEIYYRGANGDLWETYFAKGVKYTPPTQWATSALMSR